ncbi:hypothetical protein VMCG_03928 [Cytospora schulzeri]|uniref:Cytochrome c oxidase subunit 6B-like protein new16 n=1 Tax=Cytospora schulzeri TaxID=448051 RepID=A0A423WV44_9PEZI|nr:hypothetical protein VMCG_03928 [Valsa malicola]
MGLTSFWKSDTDKRAEEVRTGAVAPSRTERKKCWESRDLYFSCLDRNNILDAIKDEKAAAKSCGGEGVAFEKDCATEWVAYFKKWRVADYNKKQRIAALEAQGAQNMNIQSGPGAAPAGR